MPNVYNTIYKGDFCDKAGDDIFIEFKRRMLDTDPVPTIIPIIFAGEGDEPVTINFLNKGEYKLEPVNGSSISINIKAIDSFELSSLYTADEREWLVVISGAWNHQGWLIPDSCIEPFESKPYDVSVEATDSLGTLKDVPFLKADGTKYKGFIYDLDVLRFALEKTGLSLPFIIGVNTFEEQMVTTDSPLAQSFINCARFIDSDGNAFSCHEVIRSIMARYSARLFQFNGYWQVVNVLEQSQGVVDAFEYSELGVLIGTTTIGNTITGGGQDREIRPVGSTSFAKAYASSTAYYQYGYGGNTLPNGNMDIWTSKPLGLPDGWVVQNGAVAHTEIRLDQNGNPTTDYYVVIDSSGETGFLGQTEPVLVRAQETTTVTFDLLCPTAPGGASLVFLYLGVLIHDGAGNYFTNNNGWQPGFQFYVIQYRSGDFGERQVSVNFKVNAREADYDLYFGVQSIQGASSGDYPTSINNVQIVPAVNSDQSKPPVGLFNRQKSLAPQTFTPEPILLLHGDEPNEKRTSQISIGLPPPVNFTSSWTRNGIAETSSLLDIVANTELILHSRPYRIFEAEFIGYGIIDINTLLTVDLLVGNYIFLSGTFDLKSSIHTLRFAETLIDDIPHTTEIKEDYGSEKDKNGVSVGVPSGVNAPSSGGASVSLDEYAKIADIPVKASAIETENGTNDDKFITPFKLIGWWTNIKTLAANISGAWTFSQSIKSRGLELLNLNDIAYISRIQSVSGDIKIELGNSGNNLAVSGGRISSANAPVNSIDVVRIIDLCVTNNTASPMSASSLNSSYPSAIEGFRVQCPVINITYSKSGSGWLQYTTSSV